MITFSTIDFGWVITIGLGLVAAGVIRYLAVFISGSKSHSSGP